MKLDKKKFCKLYCDYYGTEIDNVKQLVSIKLSGKELYKFCRFVINHNKKNENIHH